MATGDNIDTGIAVAIKCGIVTKKEIYIAHLEKFSSVISFDKIIETQNEYDFHQNEIKNNESDLEDYSSDDELSPDVSKLEEFKLVKFLDK